MNISIVEDEPKLANLLKDYLQNDGFNTSIFHDGSEALDSLMKNPGDLILLDLMLPGTDGMSICRELRKHSNVPIIMLTAKAQEIDRLLGLEIGADDFSFCHMFLLFTFYLFLFRRPRRLRKCPSVNHYPLQFVL